MLLSVGVLLEESWVWEVIGVVDVLLHVNKMLKVLRVIMLRLMMG